MRLLHPETLKILSRRDNIPKTHLAHCWAELFKWKASGQKHPKMFLTNDVQVGSYMRLVYDYGILRGCDLDRNKAIKINLTIGVAFIRPRHESYLDLFDDNYLFSDAVSLYLKGVNIFPDIFGDKWRKYVPIESHKEMLRVLGKYVNPKPKDQK